MIKPETSIALGRFGYGPTRSAVASVGEKNPRDWILDQVEIITPSPFKPGMIGSNIDDIRPDGSGSKKTRSLWVEQSGKRVIAQAKSETPFSERLVAFWLNHFTVSISRSLILGIAGDFERDAIRPNVAGKFSAMLRASSLHPAMLIYLDQISSVGPDSRVGSKRGVGLNENLAREILELHTLGVDGGYGQDDVEGFAAALTGWSLDPPGRKAVVRTAFHEDFHQPGVKKLPGLGWSVNESGPHEVTQILDALSMHPSTARYVCTKMLRHFVADNPARGDVEVMVRVWLETGGDLPSVTREMLSLGSSWASPLTKFRRPDEYVALVLGIVDADITNRQIVASLDTMGFRPQGAPSPAGWSDVSGEWMDPGSVMKRVSWSWRAARSLVSKDDAREVAFESFGYSLSKDTTTAIERAADPRQAMAIFLSSPEMMRR